MPTYLENLTIRLATGAAELPESMRTALADYTLLHQQPDGGFRGRDGGSDLYYTGFALRTLALVGRLDGEPAGQATRYLRSRLVGQAPIIDFLSLLYGAKLVELSAGLNVFADCDPTWPDAVATALEAFRREDGGYAKGPDGAASSTYHSFLVLLAYELLERTLPSPERLIQFIHSQHRDDGGFVEIRQMRRSGTNPTAAAVAALMILGGLDDDMRGQVVDFLADMQTDEGGLRANTQIPIADLLSTFTGALTLADLNALDVIDTGPAARFARALQEEHGGFRGAEWDTGDDVEYTFYGLGTLALLGNK